MCKSKKARKLYDVHGTFIAILKHLKSHFI
jgi:hypothetical protein